MSSNYKHSAWTAYLCEWDPIRYPGGLFAALTLVAIFSLVRVGTAFSVIVLLASLPVQVYAARRLVFTFALFLMTFGLHLAYWLATHKREDILIDERVMVIINCVFTLASLAVSAYNPHQYGSRSSPQQFQLEVDSLHCAVPMFSTVLSGADGPDLITTNN